MVHVDIVELYLLIFIVFNVAILVCNLAFIAVLLSVCFRQRHDTSLVRNGFLLSACLADLLLGSFLMPFITAKFHRNHDPDCHTQLALQLLNEFGIMFVVSWSLVALNVLHIWNKHFCRKIPPVDVLSSPTRPHSCQVEDDRPLTSPDSPMGTTTTSLVSPTQSHTESQYFLSSRRRRNWPCHCLPKWVRLVAVTLLPWVVGAAILTPLVRFGANFQVFQTYTWWYEDVFCFIDLTKPAAIAMQALCFEAPVLVCLLCMFVSMCQIKNGVSRGASRVNHGSMLRNTEMEDEAVVGEGEGDNDHTPRADHPANESEATVTAPRLEPSGGHAATSVETTEEIADDQREYRYQYLQHGAARNQFNQETTEGTSHLPQPSKEPATLFLPTTVYIVGVLPALMMVWRVYAGSLFFDFLSTVLYLSRSIGLPLSWMVYPDLRMEAARCWRYLRSGMASPTFRTRSMTSSNSSVTFSRLQESQVV